MKLWQVLVAAALLIIAAQQFAPRLFPARVPEMHALDDPAGFRAVPPAQVSSAAAVFAGLGDGPRVAPYAGNVCKALFPTAPEGVPVAYFLDYQCPYCRVLSDVLTDIEGVSIKRQWLTDLGDSSMVAARAAIAADTLGAGDAVYARLRRSVVVAEDTYVATLAESVGLDPDALLEEMDSPATDRRLAEAAGLAARFGLPGTPALVIGRTLVVGEADRGVIEAIVALEAKAGPLPCR